MLDYFGVVDTAPEPRRNEDDTIMEAHFTHVSRHTVLNTSNRPPSPGSTTSLYHLTCSPAQWTMRSQHQQQEHQTTALSQCACTNQNHPRQRRKKIDSGNGSRHRLLHWIHGILKDPEFIHSINEFIQKEKDTREALKSPPPIGEHWDRLKETCLQMGQEFANKKTRQQRRDEINLPAGSKKPQ